MKEMILYLNPRTGSDSNAGTQDAPLFSLAEATRRVNAGGKEGPLTIVLSEGVYAVAETTRLSPGNRAFTKEARLTIRAEVLPDDPEWNIGRMPTLVHTLPVPSSWNDRPDELGGAANGLLVETSHVTVRGLRILGLPTVETPEPGLKRRLYAIARLDSGLDDLEISQCLFLSDGLVAPNHVGVIARGDGVNVHHCVFYGGGMKDAVVFWSGGSKGHSLRSCVFHGMYSSSVWTSGIGNDFVYEHNVVDSVRFAWIYQSAASSSADASGSPVSLGATSKANDRYRVVDSLFASNGGIAGTGTGARIEYAELDASFLELLGTRVTDVPVVFELDSTKRGFLHPVEGTEAAKIGAGLFTQSSGGS